MRYFFLLCLLFASSIQAKTILVLGDSLSAGYGIEIEQSWVSLLQHRLAERGDYTVVNASISGNTTSMGLGRTAGLLAKHKPDVVIVELGGNDGLQGHPLRVMRSNLGNIITAVQNTKAQVLLVGIQIPPNYGARYTDEFFSTFQTLADEHKVPLVPFLLDKVALEPTLMQGDGVHPTAEAQPILLENVWPHLEPLLE